MTPKEYLSTFFALRDQGFPTLAGEYLIKASHFVETPVSHKHEVDLETARRYNLHPHETPISYHLSCNGTSRPALSQHSSVGRLYSLTPAQREWLSARFDSTPTSLVLLAFVTARDDDPTVVDQACIESLITGRDTGRSKIMTRCTFTWAQLMAHDLGLDPWSGLDLKDSGVSSRVATIKSKPDRAPTLSAAHVLAALQIKHTHK